jgi:hypothetical protein
MVKEQRIDWKSLYSKSNIAIVLDDIVYSAQECQVALFWW